jgi:CubicO group peptidase (beta-lactamase class C family)
MTMRLSLRWMIPALLCSLSLAPAQSPAIPGKRASIDNLFPQLEDYIRDGMQKLRVPGVAVAIVYQDKVVYMKGFGVREVGRPALVNPDTVFQLASVSKPITSTVVASLVGDGQISWDDKIIDLDPDFQLSDPSITAQVTIRDLLSHRSGLPTSSGDVLEELDFSRPEILRQMRLIHFVGEFRKSYNYNNFAFTEGGIAPAKKVHESWENLADEHLFKPLGMTSSSYRWSDYRNSPNKAAIHVFLNGKPVPRYLRIPDAEAPAGSASSSIRDMAQWVRLQLADGRWNYKQVIASQALKDTHAEVILRGHDPATGKPSYYGLGWGVDKDADGRLILSHSGAFSAGAATVVRLSPSDQLGIVVLTNAVPTGLAESIAFQLFDLYHYGNATKDWLAVAAAYFKKMIEGGNDACPDYSKLTPPASAAVAKPLSAYAGRYGNDYYGQIEITNDYGLLWMRMPDDGSLYALIHWDGDTFIYRPYGEMDKTARAVKFTLGDKPQVLLENLALEGNGVFIRSAP